MKRRLFTGAAALVLGAGTLALTAGSAPATSPSQMSNGWYYPLGSAVAVSAGFLANNCGEAGYGTYIDRNGVPQYHLGADYPAADGTDVYAMGDGDVILSGDWGEAWGKYAFVHHDDAGVVVLYGHLQAEPSGDVTAGVKFADIHGDHLHLGVRPGETAASQNQGMLSCPSEWPDSGNPPTNGFEDPESWFDANPLAEEETDSGATDTDSPETELLLYNPGSGLARVYNMSSGGALSQIGASATWSSGYEITPIDIDSDSETELLLYNPGSGLARVYNMSSGGALSQIGASATWSSGYEITPIDIDSD